MINLLINSKEYTFEGPEEMPLLWAIRDYLELTGTKYGCGIGVCGSCSVLAGGNSIRSCITPVSAVRGKSIVTIEGVAQHNKFLLESWKELNVPQCGFCQPGQLVNAVALLEQSENPSDADIDNAMSGNICRCGTYVRIRAAIKRAAELSKNETS